MLNAPLPQPASKVLTAPLRRWRLSQSHRSSTHGSPWMSSGFQPKVRSIASGTGPTYTTSFHLPQRVKAALADTLAPPTAPHATRAPMSDPSHAPAQHAAGAGARVAVAHDYLLVMRGAERTFAAIAELYRQAPIFTLL